MLTMLGPTIRRGTAATIPMDGDDFQMHRRTTRTAGTAIAGIVGAAVACAALAAQPPKSPAQPGDSGPLDLAIAIDGPALAVAPKEPGRLVRLAFQGKAGQRVGLGITDIRMSPASVSAILVSVRGPEDELVSTGPVHCFAASEARPVGACDDEFTTAKGGKYVVEVDLPFSAKAAFHATLSRAITGKLTTDGPQTARLARAGQDARFEIDFDGVHGMSIEARDVTSGRSAGAFMLRLFQPDGKLLRQAEGAPGGGASLALAGGAGTYSVEVDPSNAGAGTFELAARTAAVLAFGGPPLAFTSPGPGISVQFPFSANAGEDVGFAIDGLAHDPDVDSNSRIILLKPDGERLQAVGCFARVVDGLQVQPCKLYASLPASGRYTVEIAPPPRAKASGRLLASRPVVGSLAAGTPVALGPMKPAQIAIYTFTGSAGQSVGVALADLATDPKGTTVKVTLQAKEGFGPWSSSAGQSGTVKIAPTVLPRNGAYTVTVDPGLGAVKSGQLSLLPAEGKPQ
jgi:hypothetical protein